MLYKGTWTRQDVRDLKRLFPGHLTDEVADLLNRPVAAVKKKAERLKLRKTKQYLRTLGRKV